MRYLLLCVAFAFGGNAFADDDHDAEAALALAAAAHKKPTPAPVPTPPKADDFDINGPTPEGYEKVSIDGGPWHFRKIESKKPAPEVAVPKGANFRHAGHDCPSCGYTSPAGTGTWIVRGFNADGSHSHTCPKCGQSWNH